jgi:integrase
MATITLRLSAKTDKATSQHEILIRFRHGKIDQYGATNVFVQPEYWSDEEQGKIVIPNWRTLTDERKKTQKDLEGKNERLTKIKSFVQSSFQELDKQAVEKGWLKKLINGFNFPTTADTTEAQEEQKQKSFFDWFELFLATKNYPHGSTKSFRVLERALGRYQGYKQSKDKKFILDIDTITKDTINDFFKYFKNEYLFAQKNPKLFSRLLRDYPTEITQKHKTPTITERGHNHIVNLQKKFKRFFLWLNKEGYSTNHPFDGFEIKPEQYGTPIILTLDERNQIADFDLSATPHLERQRDVFIFQCLIGCRVGDLLKMTPNNVVDGQIEYIPRKTKDNKPVTAEIPLNPRATAILDKYRNMDLSAYKSKRNPNPLLPFISSQKYNESIKEVFKVCGINRMVTVLDPVSGEQMQKPFYEVASSHLARRTFVGLLYNQIQDPNLISSMSGHVEGSREFARYRKIEREAKEKAVNLIN